MQKVKVVQKVKVKNDLGLHVRPAAAIVKILQNYVSSVYFTHKNDSINARSIMSILMLVAKKNTTLTITAEGKDAKELMEALTQAFEAKFGEK